MIFSGQFTWLKRNIIRLEDNPGEYILYTMLDLFLVAVIELAPNIVIQLVPWVFLVMNAARRKDPGKIRWKIPRFHTIRTL